MYATKYDVWNVSRTIEIEATTEEEDESDTEMATRDTT